MTDSVTLMQTEATIGAVWRAGAGMRAPGVSATIAA